MRLGEEVARLLAETLSNTPAAARRIIGYHLPLQVGLLALLLTAVLSLIPVFVLQLMVDRPLGGSLSMYGNALIGLPLQCVSMVTLALIMAGAGLPFHGQLRFRPALFLSIWLQFVITCALSLLIVLLVILPLAGFLFWMITVVAVVWILGVFTFVLNDPVHPGLLTVGLIVATLVMTLAMLVILVLLGVNPEHLSQGTPDV